MTKEQEASEKAFSNAKHGQWLKQEFTFECLDKLKKLRQDLIIQAEDLAASSIPDTVTLRNRLVQAQQIRKIIDYVFTNTYPA